MSFTQGFEKTAGSKAKKALAKMQQSLEKYKPSIKSSITRRAARLGITPEEHLKNITGIPAAGYFYAMKKLKGKK